MHKRAKGRYCFSHAKDGIAYSDPFVSLLSEALEERWKSFGTMENYVSKDSCRRSKIYYQGAQKVASVLTFAVFSVCTTQSLKLVAWLYLNSRVKIPSP